MERTEEKDIIQCSEIVDIVSKYKASQKFLSRILGWGEITLTRYINNNYAPNKTNSDKLRSIDNPYVFMKILESKIEETNGEILKETAFVKLQMSVNNHIKDMEKIKGKIFLIVNWFLSQMDDENRLTIFALHRLLYFSQAWSITLNDTILFEDVCEMTQTGPIYIVLQDEFQEFGSSYLPRVEKPDLTKEEEIILESVKKYYYDVYTPKVLGYMCCTEQNIKSGTVKEYYQKVSQEYNITTDKLNNIKKYLADLYLVVEMP